MLTKYGSDKKVNDGIPCEEDRRRQTNVKDQQDGQYDGHAEPDISIPNHCVNDRRYDNKNHQIEYKPKGCARMQEDTL